MSVWLICFASIWDLQHPRSTPTLTHVHPCTRSAAVRRCEFWYSQAFVGYLKSLWVMPFLLYCSGSSRSSSIHPSCWDQKLLWYMFSTAAMSWWCCSPYLYAIDSTILEKEVEVGVEVVDFHWHSCTQGSVVSQHVHLDFFEVFRNIEPKEFHHHFLAKASMMIAG